MTTSTDRYRITGALGSPYSMKLRAIMRYRHLPLSFVLRTPRNRAELAHVKPNIVPMLQYPGETEYRVDSTPLAYALEARHPGQRSIIPDDPGMAFLSHLLEALGAVRESLENLRRRVFGERYDGLGGRVLTHHSLHELGGVVRRLNPDLFRSERSLHFDGECGYLSRLELLASPTGAPDAVVGLLHDVPNLLSL